MNIKHFETLRSVISERSNAVNMVFMCRTYSVLSEVEGLVRFDLDPEPLSTLLMEDNGIRGCGTVRCIAGWAAALMGRSADAKALADWLEIPFLDARCLTYPPVGRAVSLLITRCEMLHALDHYRITGDVDWSLVLGTFRCPKKTIDDLTEGAVDEKWLEQRRIYRESGAHFARA